MAQTPENRFNGRKRHLRLDIVYILCKQTKLPYSYVYQHGSWRAFRSGHALTRLPHVLVVGGQELAAPASTIANLSERHRTRQLKGRDFRDTPTSFLSCSVEMLFLRITLNVEQRFTSAKLCNMLW